MAGHSDDDMQNWPHIKKFFLNEYNHLCIAYRKDSSEQIKMLAKHIQKQMIEN